MIEADALVVHINPIQEIIQPEGDRNWSGLVAKLEEVVQKLSVPVVAKEVGFGLSEDAVKRLYQIGVRIFDTAGWGGTNWSYVEAMRGKADKDLGLLFSDWGIPTTQSIKVCSAFRKTLKNNKPEIIILGSGGVRNGIQIAKALCLGADLAGLAGPFGKAAMQSSTKVDQLIGRLVLELKTAMFGVGASSIRDLKKISLQEEN